MVEEEVSAKDALTFEQWKGQLATALERQFGWGSGEGLIYIGDEADEAWREAYDEGLSPEDMAYQEFAGMLADEGNEGPHG